MELPRIANIATAVPPYLLRQSDIATAMEGLFGPLVGDFDRYLSIFENAAIDTRHSSVPLDWYLNSHSFPERNAIYVETSLTLLEKLARDILNQAGLAPTEIAGLMVVSSTGIATPSLDSYLASRLGFRPDIQRTPLFGLGCAAGVTGLARTAQLAQVKPENIYMFLVVELCGLTFQADDLGKSNIVSSALFGDGAAGLLVGCGLDGPALVGSGEHTWPDTADVMGWDLRDQGLGVILSRDIPAIVRTKFAQVAHDYLGRYGLSVDDIGAIAAHPGGAKVLDALEQVFALEPGAMTVARDILRRYGNMSAATVLFILRDILVAGPPPGKLLMTSMGPGFTASLAHLEIA